MAIAAVEVRVTDVASPVAQALIEALNRELIDRYPEEGMRHFRLEAEEVAPGRGAIVVAYAGGRPAGCGAVRRVSDTEAEIKRMYTAPEARGRGVGTAILTALEDVARTIGASRLILETGVRQPEAQALYRRLGFAVTEPYGEYVDQPLSICMAKELARGPLRPAQTDLLFRNEAEH